MNKLTGRGGLGSGSDFAGKVILRAGDDGDTLDGGSSHDQLFGGAGNDVLSVATGTTRS